MSGIANDNARKRNSLKLGVVGQPATRQNKTRDVASRGLGEARPTQMTSQSSYGIAPLSDEEVRLLPAAHQYSS